MDYIRTWSSYSAWQDKLQTKKRSDGGEGDVVDEMFDNMRSAEPDWQEDEVWMEIEIEWGTGLLLARRRRSSFDMLSSKKDYQQTLTWPIGFIFVFHPHLDQAAGQR